jgi:site-specific recombinase XerC
MLRDIAEHRAIDRPAPPVQSRVIVCPRAWSTRQSGFAATDGTDGVSGLGWSRAQERIMQACFAETGEQMRPWTPHDLRRTVASMIAEALGIEGERFLKRVLDHADRSATEIYNRYSYIRELRKVLNDWTTELTRDQPSWSFAPYPALSSSVSAQLAA